MGLTFHHLDDIDVRSTMVDQWNAEHVVICRDFGPRDRPYGKLLTESGWAAVAVAMPTALASKTDDWLQNEMSSTDYWVQSYQRRNRSGTWSDVNYDKEDAVRRFALTEFNTAYVQAVATVGLNRGHSVGTIYRAGTAEEKRSRCTEAEGPVSLTKLIDDFRCYFPGPPAASAMSVPNGPNCHHSVLVAGF
jgi:hypothetical protein